ncbi:MAG: TatD family hydrolase [Pseudomonadota bacterium]
MQIFDSHIHLQDQRIYPQINNLLLKAKAKGIMRFLCCGTSEKDWKKVSFLAKKYNELIPSYGLHPWFIEQRTDNWFATLCKYIDENNSLVCIGEIGLDHGLIKRDDALQEEVFIKQLLHAKENKLPVSIHCRRAWDRVIYFLQKYGPFEKGLLIHSYSGSEELIEKLVSLNVYFSFSGTLTFSGNKRAHKAIVKVPSDRLFLETDAPDMLPVIKGVYNKDVSNIPENIIYVYEKAAMLLGITVSELARITWENSERLFTHVR